MSGRGFTAQLRGGDPESGSTSRIIAMIVFATAVLVALGLIIGILVTVLNIQESTDDMNSYLESALEIIQASFANLQVLLSSIETTLNFLVSSSQQDSEDHEEILIAINDLVLGSWFCPSGFSPSYSALVTGSGTTASSTVDGNATIGLFAIGFDAPLHWVRSPCGHVTGILNTIATFTTDEECPDLNDEYCPRETTKRYARLECLEVDSTNDGDTIWFSAQTLSADDDPRIPAYDQYTVRGIIPRWITYGRIEEPSSGPNVRSLMLSSVLQLSEGIDNAVLEIGEIGGVSLSACAGYEANNLCSLKDAMFDGQADFVLLCEDDEHVCSYDSSIVGCQFPNINADNTGTARDTSVPCWIEATSFRWLDEEGEPFGPIYANTIKNACNPPQESLYTLADITRTFTSGHITITKTD